MRNRTFQIRSEVLCLTALVLCCIGCDVAATAPLPRVLDNRILGNWRGPEEIGRGSTKVKLYQVRASGDHYQFGDDNDFKKNEAASFSLAKIGNLFLVQEVSDKP